MWDFFLGLLGLANSGANREAQAEENRINREWNEKMIHEAREWELEQWNRTNEYNSPEQQMQRFSEAGLNPNLIYGQGSPGLAGQLSTSAPSGNQSAPQFDISPIFQAAQLAQNRQHIANQTELTNSQVSLMQSQVKTEAIKQVVETARSKYLDAQTKSQIIGNTLQSAIQPELIDQARLATDIAVWQRSISRLSAEQKQFQLDKIMPLEAVRIQVQNQATQAGIELTAAQVDQVAALTRKALLDGDMTQLQYEYDSYLRQYGISPDTPGWFKSAVHPFTWENVVFPIFDRISNWWNGDDNPINNSVPGGKPNIQYHRNPTTSFNNRTGISNNIHF